MELREKEEKTRKLQYQNAENQKKITDLQKEFNNIKQVTGLMSNTDTAGADDVTKMINKFIDQKTNRKNLEKEVKDAERKLTALKRDYGVMEKGYLDLQTSGSGQAEFGREQIKSIENEIMRCKLDMRLLVASAERTMSTHNGLIQGAAGLLLRAAPHSELLREPGVFDITNGPQVLSLSLISHKIKKKLK